jgi:protein SCO1/2
MALCGVLVSVISAAGAMAAADKEARPVPPGFEDARVVEKPDAQLPLDTEFVDENGKTVRLGDYFKPNRPVLLMMIYLRCPMLCNLTLNGVVTALKPMELIPGRDFELVTISFDPREDPELARSNKDKLLKKLDRPEAEAGWHLLTSSKPEAGRAVGEKIGFGYKQDAKGDYLHESAIYVCTPQGRVARTIQGVQFDTDMLNDSLINASEGKISRGLFGVALSCGLFHYDAESGKYTWAVMATTRVLVIGSVLIMAAIIGTLIYRDTHKRRNAEAGASPASD